MRPRITGASESIPDRLRTRVSGSVSGIPGTIRRMGDDLRQLLRVSYLRVFLYTAGAAFVLLYGTVYLYDYHLLPPTGVEDAELTNLDRLLVAASDSGADLVLFAAIAGIPVMNSARHLFLARLSGRDPAERFTPRTLFERRGVELVLVVAVVPFLSRQLFEATGLQGVIGALTPLTNQFLGSTSAETVQPIAITASVLFLYPSIILVYLSHSKLSELYPFTQFLTIARSWNYALLVATTIPVVLLAVTVLEATDRSSVSNLSLMAVFAVLSTVVLHFVFVRLGSIVRADERLRETFAGVIEGEVQTTLTDFIRVDIGTEPYREPITSDDPGGVDRSSTRPDRALEPSAGNDR